jgi:cytoskeleton protein RodZ
MPDIGRELKEAREVRGLTLEQISASTMIARKYLLALEEEDYSKFAGEVYLKGALRKYAAELGLDGDTLLSRYNGTPSAEKEKPLPQEKKAAKPVVAPPNVVSVKPARRLRVGRLALYLTIIALLFAAYYLAGSIDFRSPVVEPPPNQNGNNEPVPPPDNEPAEEEPPQELPPPEPRLAADAQNPRLYYLYNTGNVSAQLTFSSQCWVSVTADGREIIRQTFNSGQSQSVSADNELVIRLGYPRGVRLTAEGIDLKLPPSDRAVTTTIRKAAAE